MAEREEVRASRDSNGLRCLPRRSAVPAGNDESGPVSPCFDLPQVLRDVARDVLRIGSGRRADPESLIIAREEAAARLHDLARRLGGRR